MSQDEMKRRIRHGSPFGDEKEVMEQWRMMYKHQVDQPGVHELMQELRQVIDEYPDRMLVGESEDIAFHGDGTNELHLTFNFPLMKTDHLTPQWIRDNQKERLTALEPLDCWPCNTLNNHDSSRVYSRYGDGRNDDAIARTSLALMLTLRGTPFLYNGEEIGMSNYRLTDLSQFRDPPAMWFYNMLIAEGMTPEQALIKTADTSRDRCRTPFQWTHAPNAGFSPEGVQTWLPVNPNYADGVNVADEQSDPTSMLNFYKQMLRLRKQAPALVYGEYTPVHESAEDYIAFLRTSTQQTCLVILNLCEQPQAISFELPANTARCLFSTEKSTNEIVSLNDLKMAPFEILIGELTSS
jgi:alpha-glucosidase